MRSRIIWTTVVSGVVLIVIGLMRLSLAALQEPAPLERRIASLVKHSVIRLASHRGIPPAPSDTGASIEEGLTHYGLDCGLCHGIDGRGQTPPGQWMYPRAADLTSERVQSYSDEELFWIINNGIRFTGMPGFGKVETPDHIWGLVKYMRTLRSTGTSGLQEMTRFVMSKEQRQTQENRDAQRRK
jgi:mono/diheme cytochrome c family protein